VGVITLLALAMRVSVVLGVPVEFTANTASVVLLPVAVRSRFTPTPCAVNAVGRQGHGRSKVREYGKPISGVLQRIKNHTTPLNGGGPKHFQLGHVWHAIWFS
jgi:hypothetical protein